MIYEDGKSKDGHKGVPAGILAELVKSANKELLEEIRELMVGLPAAQAGRVRRAANDDPEVLRQLAREMASSGGDIESNFDELGKSSEIKGDEGDDDIIDMLAGMGGQG